MAPTTTLPPALLNDAGEPNWASFGRAVRPEYARRGNHPQPWLCRGDPPDPQASNRKARQ